MAPAPCAWWAAYLKICLAMIITCPECATQYEVSNEIFLKGPRKVRCVSCGNAWMQEPLQEDTQPPADSMESEIFADAAPDMEDDQAAAGDMMTSSDDAGESPEQTEDAADGKDTSEAAEDYPPHDIESAVSRLPPAGRNAARSNGRGGTKRWKGWLALAACLLVVAGNAFYFREQIVRFVPATAALYARLGLPVNLIGVDFAGIELERDYENGFPVLTVRGEVVNVSGRPLPVPDVGEQLSHDTSSLIE